MYGMLPPVPDREGKVDTGHALADIPPQGTSTHFLHLAPHGAILPHVDNLEASGSVIIGTSLGAERVLRLKDTQGDSGWDVRLPSGSLYLQR
jgi:alkylated DNA repair protein alkB family protein 7